MIINLREDHPRSRQGIALVVVLGLLSLMTLLATAFVYFMRTENTVANYYRMEISSRHVLNVALARALMDITTNLNDEVYPDWSGQFNAMVSTPKNDTSSRFCKEEFVDAMCNAISNIPGGAFMPLGTHLTGLASNLVPSTADFADGNENFMVVNLTQNTAGWITINKSVNLVTVRNKKGLVWWRSGDRFAKVPLPKWDIVDVDGVMQDISGKTPSSKLVQYAYAVFNCSGLLDANYVGLSNSVRRFGVSANEIQLGAVVGNGKDFSEASALDVFYEDRNTFEAKYGKYESVKELFEKNEGFAHWPENFTVYSRFPSGEYAPSNALAMTGTVSRLMLIQSGILKYLKTYIPRANSQYVYDSLLDYVDEDSIPCKLDSPTVERVPMINELAIRTKITLYSDGTMTNQARPYVEVMYPFSEDPLKGPYWLEVEIIFKSGSGTAAALVPPPYHGIKEILNIEGGNPYPDAVRMDDIPIPLIIYTNLPNQNYQLRAQVRAAIYRGPISTVNLIDSVPYPTNTGWTADAPRFNFPSDNPARVLPTTSVAVNQISNNWAGTECIDPRYNWKRVIGATNYWVEIVAPQQTTLMGMNIPGGLNTATYNYWTNQVCSDPFETNGMYVANRPLVSIAELGYLPSGTMLWDTLRVVGGQQLNGTKVFPADPIFDAFTLTSDAVAWGKINPNTYDTNVIAAAFCSIPLDQYPYQTNSPSSALTTNEAYALANLWTNSVIQNRIANYSNLIDHVMDLMDNPAGPRYPLFATTNHTVPFRNESLLRNSVGLFDARQNYFFVVLVASEITKGFDNVNTDLKSQVFSFNSRSALIELWRDPYEVDGQNSLVIRNYRLLDE